MFTYNSLLEACKNLKLDPALRGTNIFANAHPSGYFADSIDLTSLGFPQMEQEQVEMIGALISNLISQQKFPEVYNLASEQGKEEVRRNKMIEVILPVAHYSHSFWLHQGLNLCSEEVKKRNLSVHNGKVLEVDPSYEKAMDTFNKAIDDDHREFVFKNARSEQDANNTILK